MKFCLYMTLACTALVMHGCSENNIRVKGRFVGAENSQVVLMKIIPGSQIPLDTACTDKKGNFRFRIKPTDLRPHIYNLQYKQEIIPLLLNPGEKVEITSIGELSKNYKVEGSPGSLRLLELRNILAEGSASLDSIRKKYEESHESQKDQVLELYASTYYAIKRNHIKFIIDDLGSLSSVYALYQRLQNDAYLADGLNDLIYYKQVADSVSQVYPDHPYVIALQKDIANAEGSSTVMDMISEALISDSGFPDIELSDMYGEIRRLSDLRGQTILLDFWVASSPESSLINAEYKDIYNTFHSNGFEIYQVSGDTSRPLWITAVQDQRLPWITVSDFKGAGGMAFLRYNVRSVPSNFLIDRKGEIVAKNVYGTDLAKELSKLIN